MQRKVDDMKLIVGLGNPTDKYENTYHNLGFMTIDRLAEKMNLKIKNADCQSLTAVTSVNGETVVLAKPQTYMNLSGVAVKSLAKKFGASDEDIFVAFDDCDIDLGQVKIKADGSGGTHNGMKNIVSELQSKNFKRIKIGFKDELIAERRINIVDKVLSKISKKDKDILDKSIDVASDSLLRFVEGVAFDKIQAEVNKR